MWENKGLFPHCLAVFANESQLKVLRRLLLNHIVGLYSGEWAPCGGPLGEAEQTGSRTGEVWLRGSVGVC